MPLGSCFCGNIKVKYTGSSITAGICHCLDCRKLSGSPYTLNFLSQRSELQVTGGEPKEIAKTADSGNAVKNYFCPDCGTPLYGGSVGPDGQLSGALVIRAGIFEDENLLSKCKPVVEIFTSQRLEWIVPVEGCKQIDGMLPAH